MEDVTAEWIDKRRRCNAREVVCSGRAEDVQGVYRYIWEGQLIPEAMSAGQLTAASAFCIWMFINPRPSSPMYQIIHSLMVIPGGGSTERKGAVLVSARCPALAAGSDEPV